MSAEEGPINDNEADAEVLDEQPRSILLGMIKQLTKGMDLHRVTLPTFVLEPRSMLERITDFMSHPDLILKAAKEKDEIERFLLVLKYYLSGWHIRPKGVKKPYNPILGEIFRARWKFEDGNEAFYVAEQVSHHPPISSFYYQIPEQQVFITGEFRPSSKFLGNSAATIMRGGTTIKFGAFPDEEYYVTMPNVYVRGILFGTMVLELGDTATMKCDSSDLVAELEFTTKGFFSGTYNGIKGKIKRQSSGETLYTLSGKWSEVIYIQKNKSKGDPEVFFDVSANKIHPKIVKPEAEQEEYESRRLWTHLTAALQARDMDKATEEKTKVEDSQRKIRQEREEKKNEHKSRFFTCEKDAWTLIQERELWESEPLKSKEKIEKIIFP